MTKSKPLPSLAVLQEFFSYDPETGLLVRAKRSNNRLAGAVVGCADAQGYLTVNFQKSHYKVHRIAWLFITRLDPGELTIDHIDGNRSNNRAANLRLATRQQQVWNTPEGRGWYEQNGRYFSAIRHRGQQRRLGGYATAEEAHAAYVEACVKLRGEWTPNCYTDDVPQHQIHGNP